MGEGGGGVFRLLLLYVPVPPSPSHSLQSRKYVLTLPVFPPLTLLSSHHPLNAGPVLRVVHLLRDVPDAVV